MGKRSLQRSTRHQDAIDQLLGLLTVRGRRESEGVRI
jgi:hypothetical protein